MLDFDEKGSNVLPLVHIVLVDVFFLFLGVFLKKNEKFTGKDHGDVF